MTIVYILLFIIIAALAYFIYLQKQVKPQEIDINKALSTLINLNNEQLSKEKQIISTDLSNKKDAIEKMVKDISENLSKVEKERLGSFTNLRDAIENNVKLTKELSVTTEGLKRVLSNNQQRGAFGEKVAEDLLKMSGFVIGTDYTRQETTGDARPDFTLFSTRIRLQYK